MYGFYVHLNLVTFHLFIKLVSLDCLANELIVVLLKKRKSIRFFVRKQGGGVEEFFFRNIYLKIC